MTTDAPLPAPERRAAARSGPAPEPDAVDAPPRAPQLTAVGASPAAPSVELVVRFPVDDIVLSRLHARAFGGDPAVVIPWAARLARHALTWVGAFDRGALTGFVQVAWDGGAHAFILDTMVDPRTQGRGIGSALVAAATAEAREAGCDWLHVDFEDHLTKFYLDRGGFRPTRAGLIALGASTADVAGSTGPAVSPDRPSPSAGR